MPPINNNATTNTGWYMKPIPLHLLCASAWFWRCRSLWRNSYGSCHGSWGHGSTERYVTWVMGNERWSNL